MPPDNFGLLEAIEVYHPQGIEPTGAELAVDLVQREWCRRIADRGDSLSDSNFRQKYQAGVQPIMRLI